MTTLDIFFPHSQQVNDYPTFTIEFRCRPILWKIWLIITNQLRVKSKLGFTYNRGFPKIDHSGIDARMIYFRETSIKVAVIGLLYLPPAYVDR